MGIEKNIKKNISLKDFTSFKIGGKAKYFFQANNKEEIIEAIKWAKQKDMPFFVLAGGSNILINDKKYKGLAIKVQSSEFKIQSYDGGFKTIEAEAGVPLGKIVGIALQNSLTGMEWAMGIPGTVGGAVYGNAGAFGQSMADVVEEVEVIDTGNFQFSIFNFQKNKCEFEYRNSVFKNNKDLIILSVKIKLQTGDKAEIERKINDAFLVKKKSQPLEFFSAGSVFKNTEKFSAGELIDKAGLKGRRIGGVEISRKHANFIVNNGRGKAKDVKKLIDITKKEVGKKFHISLEEEIQFINF